MSRRLKRNTNSLRYACRFAAARHPCACRSKWEPSGTVYAQIQLSSTGKAGIRWIGEISCIGIGRGTQGWVAQLLIWGSYVNFGPSAATPRNPESTTKDILLQSDVAATGVLTHFSASGAVSGDYLPSHSESDNVPGPRGHRYHARGQAGFLADRMPLIPVKRIFSINRGLHLFYGTNGS